MPQLRIVGVHLAGAATRKSAVVRALAPLNSIYSGVEPGPIHDLFSSSLISFFPTIRVQSGAPSITPSPLLWEAFSSEIGAIAKKDSDTRLIEVVQDMGGADIFVIDAPLSLPPCTKCELLCPGTFQCKVPEVELFLREWNERRKKDGKQRNPQPYVDRFFEMFARNQFEHELLNGGFEFEAALGANKAPLTLRAMRLYREIKMHFPNALILESNSLVAAMGWSFQTGYKINSLIELRNSVQGIESRAGLLKKLEQMRIATRAATLHPELFQDLAEHAELFLAAMSALSAWALLNGEALLNLDFLQLNKSHPLNGWACLPKDSINSVQKN